LAIGEFRPIGELDGLDRVRAVDVARIEARRSQEIPGSAYAEQQGVWGGLDPQEIQRDACAEGQRVPGPRDGGILNRVGAIAEVELVGVIPEWSKKVSGTFSPGSGTFSPGLTFLLRAPAGTERPL
jgi:hypothetical protein